MEKSKLKELRSGLYRERRRSAIAYLGDNCVKCLSKEHLEIDHVDWKTKEFTVSSRLYYTWEILKVELDKCQLLCKSCHSAKTKKDVCERRTGQKEQPHGTYWRYKKHKCRCEMCIQAHSIYNARFKPPRKRKSRTCGTYAMYKHGCRCDRCKEANKSYMKAFRNKHK